MRTIKRTYYSKKLGRNVTKVYTYDSSKYKYKHKSTRGKVLVSAKGKVNKKNVEEFKQQIDNSNYDINTKRTLKNDLDVYIYQRSRSKRKLTTNGFLGIESDDAINRLLSNLGVDADTLAEQIGVTEEDIYNEENWQNDLFTVGGTSWAINFNYTGNVLVPVL